MEETRITDSGALPLSTLDSLFESAYVVSRQGRIPGWNKDAATASSFISVRRGDPSVGAASP
jgi:hypothetical protein